MRASPTQAPSSRTSGAALSLTRDPQAASQLPCYIQGRLLGPCLQNSSLNPSSRYPRNDTVPHASFRTTLLFAESIGARLCAWWRVCMPDLLKKKRCTRKSVCLTADCLRLVTMCVRLQVPSVRLEGVGLLDLVQRSGAVAPWLYLPPAFVLSLDSSSVVSERALRILQRCAAKMVRSDHTKAYLASWHTIPLVQHSAAPESLPTLELSIVKVDIRPQCAGYAHLHGECSECISGGCCDWPSAHA